MSHEDSHKLLVELLEQRAHRPVIVRSLRAKVKEHLGVGASTRAIDPVGCGCTDCLTGRTRPARDEAEYELAQAAGCAR